MTRCPLCGEPVEFHVDDLTDKDMSFDGRRISARIVAQLSWVCPRYGQVSEREVDELWDVVL